MKMKKTSTALCGLQSALLLAAVTFNAQATVTVSDFGATAPSLNASTDTGYTPAVRMNEFDLDGPNTHGQSFTVATSGIVDKVYFGYRRFGFNDADGLVDFTFRLDVNNDGSFEIDQQFVGVDKNNFETANTINGNWIEFDLLGENITLAAGSTHGVWWNSDNPAGQQVAGVSYDNTPLADYASGESLGSVLGGGGHDTWFAVTTVPEPSSALLLLSGLAAFGLRRRRK